MTQLQPAGQAETASPSRGEEAHCESRLPETGVAQQQPSAVLQTRPSQCQATTC
jgi:hypothetical protein